MDKPTKPESLRLPMQLAAALATGRPELVKALATSAVADGSMWEATTVGEVLKLVATLLTENIKLRQDMQAFILKLDSATTQIGSVISKLEAVSRRMHLSIQQEATDKYDD